MPNRYILIRDHLEQAQATLNGHDAEARKLREVLDMVIGLIDDLEAVADRRVAQVIRFPDRRAPPAD